MFKLLKNGQPYREIKSLGEAQNALTEEENVFHAMANEATSEEGAAKVYDSMPFFSIEDCITGEEGKALLAGAGFKPTANGEYIKNKSAGVFILYIPFTKYKGDFVLVKNGVSKAAQHHKIEDFCNLVTDWFTPAASIYLLYSEDGEVMGAYPSEEAINAVKEQLIADEFTLEGKVVTWEDLSDYYRVEYIEMRV